MRVCEAIYGTKQADNIEGLIVAATGGECPCRRDHPCPLADEEGYSELALMIPKPRSDEGM